MRPRDERGAAAVELAMVIAGILLLVGLLAAAGRVWWTRSLLIDAAESAARSATLDEVRAERAALRTLTENGVECERGPRVELAATRSFGGAGVRATVTCRVVLADLPLPGPNGVDVRASAAAPRDRHRAGGGA